MELLCTVYACLHAVDTTKKTILEYIWRKKEATAQLMYPSTPRPINEIKARTVYHM